MTLQFQNLRGYRFGPFEVSLETGEMRRNGRRVRLQHKPFQILVALLEQCGKLVGRESLRQRLWPVDTFVVGVEKLGFRSERPTFWGWKMSCDPRGSL